MNTHPPLMKETMMKHANYLICLLLASSLAAPAYSAPSNWGKADNMRGVEQKIAARQYEAAIEDLKKILVNDADNADACNLLGFTHRKLKRYDVAEEYYQRALSLNPGHKGAMEYLGELYVETGRMEEANAMLARLDKACLFSCEEYKSLKEVIEKQK